MRLGKQPAKHDPRTFRLSHYINPYHLPALPSAYGYEIDNPGMLGNDRVGNCVIVGALNMIKVCAKTQNVDVSFTTAQALDIYSQVTGYNGRPETDNGTVVLDFLKWWRKNPIFGHQLLAFAALEPRNLNQLRYSTMLAGGSLMGYSLPNSALTNTDCWCIPNQGLIGDGAPRQDNGHSTALDRYSGDWFNDVSWNMNILTTDGFVKSYTDESYLLLIQDLFNAEMMATNGLNLDRIIADTKLL